MKYDSNRLCVVFCIKEGKLKAKKPLVGKFKQINRYGLDWLMELKLKMLLLTKRCYGNICASSDSYKKQHRIHILV